MEAASFVVPTTAGYDCSEDHATITKFCNGVTAKNTNLDQFAPTVEHGRGFFVFR
jgi:hypothetical protein